MPASGAPEAPEGLQAAKQDLRRVVIARRENLPPALGLIHGAMAADRLVRLPEFAAARTVLCFASFRGEIPTVYLLREVLRSGRALALPAVVRGRLELRTVVDLAGLQPSRWGIPEPPASRPPVDVSSVDLVVAPGVAFDLLGMRLGYGGGYYDRLIGCLRGAQRPRPAPVIGFAYELQVVPAVPAGPSDLPVDKLVTELRTYVFRALWEG